MNKLFMSLCLSVSALTYQAIAYEDGSDSSSEEHAPIAVAAPAPVALEGDIRSLPAPVLSIVLRETFMGGDQQGQPIIANPTNYRNVSLVCRAFKGNLDHCPIVQRALLMKDLDQLITEHSNRLRHEYPSLSGCFRGQMDSLVDRVKSPIERVRVLQMAKRIHPAYRVSASEGGPRSLVDLGLHGLNNDVARNHILNLYTQISEATRDRSRSIPRYFYTGNSHPVTVPQIFDNMNDYSQTLIAAFPKMKSKSPEELLPALVVYLNLDETIRNNLPKKLRRIKTPTELANTMVELLNDPNTQTTKCVIS